MAKKWKKSRDKKKKKKDRGGKKADAVKQAALKADPESLWVSGYERFETGKYDEATKAWTDLLKLCSSGHVPDTQKQDIDLDSLQVDLAEAHYRIAMSVPKEEVGRRNSQLSLAARYNPDKADYHHELGLTRYQNGNYRGAIDAYKTALSLAPDEDRFKISSALAYLRDGDTDRAQKLTAHVNGSAVAHAHRIRAIALTKEKKFDAACGLIATLADDPSLAAHSSGSPLQDTYERLFSAVIQLAADNISGAMELLEECQSAIETSSDGDPFLLWSFHYYRGLACYLTDDISRVKENWKHALDIVPKDKNGKAKSPFVDKMSVIANGMIDVCLQDEDFEGAIEWCDAALQLQAGAVNGRLVQRQQQTQIALANHYASQNRLLDAIRLWEAARRRDEGNLDITHNIAAAYDRLEDYRQANIYWRIVVQTLKKRFKSSGEDSIEETKERLVTAYKYLGHNYLKDGNFSQAAKQYEAALRVTPDDAKIRIELAKTLAGMRRYNEAVAHFKTILEDDPKNVTVFVEMGRVHAHRGDDNNAIKYLRKALKLDPYNQNIKQDLADLHAGKAEAHLNRNWRKRALKEFEKQSELAPQDYSPVCSMGEIQIKIGEKAQAKESFEKAISIAPNNPNVYLRAGKAYLEDGNWSKAKDNFDRALEYAKDDETLIQIGLAHCSAGHKCEPARSYFDRAIEIGDDETPMLIASRLLDHECTYAHIYAEQGVKLKPDESRRYYALAYSYFYANRYKDARSALRKARKLADRGDSRLLEAIESLSDFMEASEDGGLDLLRVIERITPSG